MDTDAAPTIRELERRLKMLTAALIVLAVGLVGAVGWLAYERLAGPPAVLSAERVDIVESDGELAMALSSSGRVPVATMDGQVLMSDQAEERDVPGIILFDGQGDEVGGMLFGVRETDEGFSATRHFSLDGYRQDQTVVLFHYENRDGASAGLRVSDRHEGPGMPEALRELGLELPFSRAELDEAIQALPEDGREQRLRELFGRQRVFLGSNRNDDAELSIRDGQGRVRIRIRAPEEGEAAITILDEDGSVAARLPEG